VKLRERLSVYFFLVIAIVAGTTLFFVRQTTESVFRSFIFSGDSEKAKIYATILGDYYAQKRDWRDLQSFLSEIPQLIFFGLDKRIHGEGGGAPPASYPFATISALLSDRIAVADMDGIIVADTSGKLLRTVHPPMHLAHGLPIMVNFEKKGTVLVGSMVDSSLTGINERFLGSITTSLVWAILISAGIAFLLGLVFSAQVTRPIAALTDAVKKVAAGDLSVAVKVGGRDEVSELSGSFNAMTGELKRLEEAKKQIIADSAHELRTPVTLIQGTIEAMIDGVYPLDIPTLESVHEETVRLSRLIDMLRELEIIESGKLALSFESVDAVEIVRKAFALFATSAAEKKIALSVEESDPPPPSIDADYLRLSEVVYNIISNSIKYTPAGGRVRVRIQGAGNGSLALISVDDSGPGIPDEERKRIFERFYRMDKSRSTDLGGSGLGLAIAGEIVKAHGGSIAVADSDLGGASFIVSLSSSSTSRNRA
jgi:signal transduction histidine kinase